jgi:hypothetical protein
MEFLAPVSTTVMAVIWVIYLQLFFVQYRRNSRPYLVFHHAQNDNPDALCLLVNMGELPVHVQTVQAVVYFKNGESITTTVTDFERINTEQHNVQQSLRQGPLLSGGYLVLGTFRNILCGDQDESEGNRRMDQIEGLELRVAVIHGPSRFPVGARRSFRIEHQPQPRIQPANIHTEQLSRKRDQNTVREWIECDLNPRRKGSSESDSSSQEELSED